MNPRRPPYLQVVRPGTTGPAQVNVCGSIHRRRDLCLGYAGLVRMVRPAVHGTDAAGTEILLAYQVIPDTDPGWRTFLVDEIQLIDELQAPLIVRGLDLSLITATDFASVHCALPGLGLRPA